MRIHALRFALLLLGVFAISCTLKPSETGTHDDRVDAEVREIQFHDKQLELLGIEIDSLQSAHPRSAEQNARLEKAQERKSWHESQREEAIRRANERGQDWNMLYNANVDDQEENRARRQPPR